MCEFCCELPAYYPIRVAALVDTLSRSLLDALLRSAQQIGHNVERLAVGVTY